MAVQPRALGRQFLASAPVVNATSTPAFATLIQQQASKFNPLSTQPRPPTTLSPREALCGVKKPSHVGGAAERISPFNRTPISEPDKA
jgi:hypothetical protein